MSIEIKTPQQLAAVKALMEHDGPGAYYKAEVALARANYAAAMQDACNDAVRGQRDACREVAMLQAEMRVVREALAQIQSGAMSA
jgi:hypothetical protein